MTALWRSRRRLDDLNRFASGEQTLAEAHARSGEGKR